MVVSGRPQIQASELPIERIEGFRPWRTCTHSECLLPIWLTDLTSVYRRSAKCLLRAGGILTCCRSSRTRTSAWWPRRRDTLCVRDAVRMRCTSACFDAAFCSRSIPGLISINGRRLSSSLPYRSCSTRHIQCHTWRQVTNVIELDASGLSTFATLYLPGSTVFRRDASICIGVLATAMCLGGWMGGWLSVTAGIVSKRLNLS